MRFRQGEPPSRLVFDHKKDTGNGWYYGAEKELDRTVEDDTMIDQ